MNREFEKFVANNGSLWGIITIVFIVSHSTGGKSASGFYPTKDKAIVLLKKECYAAHALNEKEVFFEVNRHIKQHECIVNFDVKESFTL